MADPFRQESFHYNEEEDYYVCPMGQHMERTGVRHSRTESGYITESVRYRAVRCEGCPLRCMCFKSKSQKRTIEVNHRLKEYKRKARERLTSEKGIRHRGQRCIEPEAVLDRSSMTWRTRGSDILDKTRLQWTLPSLPLHSI